MPPKRKRTDDAKPLEASTTTTARSTRSSTRKTTNTKSTTKATSSNAESNVDGATSPDVEPEPPLKKTKAAATSKATSSRLKSSTSKGKTVTKDKDRSSPLHTQRSIPEEASQTTNGTVIASMNSVATYEPYTSTQALATFGRYADEDEPEVIGPESFSRLCDDANVPMDGVLPLIIAWQMDSKEMGKISKEEWMKGTEKLQISSLSQLATVAKDLESLLILDKPSLKKPVAANASTKKKRTDEPYDRSSYWRYAADPKAAFKTLYGYCFTIAKPPQTRNIDMETATALWTVLLSPRYPIIQDIVTFINEKGGYKGVNKDVWSMTLDFCNTVQPDLSGYEADGAWPTLLDEFVSWKKGNTTA